MRARAVVGANFGDEGKGLVTDWLCRQGAGAVVRFNGGAQAGHTVVRDGKRHVFQHFGSGTFGGVPTYLSQFFIVNPILYFHEKDELSAFGITPLVYAHPDCIVTTFADMLINQELEHQRGRERHGSVGVGINETVERSVVPELKITMADLWNDARTLVSKLVEICAKYALFRTGKPIDKPESMIHAFIQACAELANDIGPLGIGQCRDPVFEGAQGLLLDHGNKEFYPHVTRSNTGLQNVRVLCAHAGIKDIDAYYVSRTYLTRHGAGHLPDEDPRMSYPDATNVEHAFQGRLRFAPLNYAKLVERVRKDAGTDRSQLVLTHMDQLDISQEADVYAWGPTAEDVEIRSRSGLTNPSARANEGAPLIGVVGT
jgi:adenylosuccinate synthase